MDEEYDFSWPENNQKEEKLEQSLKEIDLFENTPEVEVDNYGIPGGHNSIPNYYDD